MAGRSHWLGCLGTSFQARTWLSLDPCGLLGVSLSWAVHLYAVTVIAWKLLAGSLLATALYLLVYLPTAGLAMASLYQAWTTDPGAVPLGARPLTTLQRASSSTVSASNPTTTNSPSATNSESKAENGEPAASAAATATITPNAASPPPPRQRGLRRCHKCQDNFKPARAHHDSVTGRCIVKFDHFCPWVGNAVGAKNHKFFCLFLLYTAGTCLLSLVLLLLRAVRCGFVRDIDSKDEGQRPGLASLEAEDGSSRLLRGETEFVYADCNDFSGNPWIIGLLVCSITFLIFSCTMGCEQLEAIETGKSKIARMKQRVGQAGTEFSKVTNEFNELFGGDSPHATWHWFLPMPVWFPRGMEKVVMGYEWDEAFEPVPYREENHTHVTEATSSDQQLNAMENGEPSSSTDSLTAPLTAEGEDGEADGVMMTSVPSSSSKLSRTTTTRTRSGGVKNRRSNSRDDPLRTQASNHSGFGGNADEPLHADGRLT